MPPTARRGRGRATGSRGLASRISNSPASGPSQLTQIQIIGWRNSKASDNSDGGLHVFTAWLERKARVIQEKAPHHGGIQKRTAMRIRKSRVEGDNLHIFVPQEDATYFTKLDGYEFAGAVIKMRVIGGSSGGLNAQHASGDRRSPAPGKPSFSFKPREIEALREPLRTLLQQRYDMNTKVLNLSAFIEEPSVKKLLESSNNSLSKIFSALCVICEEAFPTPEARKEGVTGIQLANNGFNNLIPARALAWEFSDLVNLDLSNNKLTGIDGLGAFRRCTKLEHIIVAGNAWEEKPNFKKEILRTFQNLKFVDGTEISVEDRESSKIVHKTPAIAPGLFNDSTGLGTKFFQNFFIGFDSDRKTLVDYYYDKNSTFSYSVNNYSLKDPNNTEKPRKGEWDAWLFNSRNLLKITSAPTRKTRLHKGLKSILETFQSIPPTEHASTSDPSKWLIECTPIQGLRDPTGQSPTGVNGLKLTVHGEFVENGNISVKRRHRSFDRTFILGPGGNNPDGVGVVSDLLVVRSYGGSKAFQVEAKGPMTAEEEQATMVVEVQQKTGMNQQYAIMCLEQTGWKLEAALESFQQVKTSIPPEAYAQ